MDDSRIELVARALCEAGGKDPDETCQGDRATKQTPGGGFEETYDDVPNWRYKDNGFVADAKRFILVFDILNNSKS